MFKLNWNQEPQAFYIIIFMVYKNLIDHGKLPSICFLQKLGLESADRIGFMFHLELACMLQYI